MLFQWRELDFWQIKKMRIKFKNVKEMLAI